MRVSPKGVAVSVEVPDRNRHGRVYPGHDFFDRPSATQPQTHLRRAELNVGVISTCRFCTNLTDLREAGRRPLFALIVSGRCRRFDRHGHAQLCYGRAHPALDQGQKAARNLDQGHTARRAWGCAGRTSDIVHLPALAKHYVPLGAASAPAYCCAAVVAEI